MLRIREKQIKQIGYLTDAGDIRRQFLRGRNALYHLTSQTEGRQNIVLGRITYYQHLRGGETCPVECKLPNGGIRLTDAYTSGIGD